jgi:uroporphyrin-III C-methyltransferase/precorrin-2 dehydrogenase/sirohydrochlorin ferrochelatase
MVENASRQDRRVLAGTLQDLSAFCAGLDSDGPALILIGKAVADGALGRAEAFAAPARELAA